LRTPWADLLTELKPEKIFLYSGMIQPLPYCTYVLFSEKDAMLYVGYSSNLANRISDHNSGGTKSTASRRPLKLIFCEFYLFEQDARNRERYLKTSAGKKAIKLMLRSTLHSLGYEEKVRFIFTEETADF
jgi:putative endonuclease